jgi:RNA ligase
LDGNNDLLAPDGAAVTYSPPTDPTPVPQWPPHFEPYGKTPRWRSPVVVTEKLDGINTFILIHEDPAMPLAVGSRNRYITPGKSTDNFGFAAWVLDNEAALRRLGPGRHNGEWWGVGIGRGYGLTERRWSLFQATRWTPEELAERQLPANVYAVPILCRGEDAGQCVKDAQMWLENEGSAAVPGYTRPEGFIVALAAMGFKPMKYVFENKVGPSPEEG